MVLRQREEPGELSVAVVLAQWAIDDQRGARVTAEESGVADRLVVAGSHEVRAEPGAGPTGGRKYTTDHPASRTTQHVDLWNEGSAGTGCDERHRRLNGLAALQLDGHVLRMAPDPSHVGQIGHPNARALREREQYTLQLADRQERLRTTRGWRAGHGVTGNTVVPHHCVEPHDRAAPDVEPQLPQVLEIRGPSHQQLPAQTRVELGARALVQQEHGERQLPQAEGERETYRARADDYDVEAVFLIIEIVLGHRTTSPPDGCLGCDGIYGSSQLLEGAATMCMRDGSSIEDRAWNTRRMESPAATERPALRNHVLRGRGSPSDAPGGHRDTQAVLGIVDFSHVERVSARHAREPAL